jgi:acyl carrier protein
MDGLNQWEQRVLGVFAGLDREVDSVEEDLFDSGLLDSMTFVELLARLEDEFGITFRLQDLELDSFRSVRAIAAWLRAARAAAVDATGTARLA